MANNKGFMTNTPEGRRAYQKAKGFNTFAYRLSLNGEAYREYQKQSKADWVAVNVPECMSQYQYRLARRTAKQYAAAAGIDELTILSERGLLTAVEAKKIKDRSK